MSLSMLSLVLGFLENLLAAVIFTVFAVPFFAVLAALWLVWCSRRVGVQSTATRRLVWHCPQCRSIVRQASSRCGRGHIMQLLYDYNAAMDAPVRVAEHNPYATQPMAAVLGSELLVATITREEEGGAAWSR